MITDTRRGFVLFLSGSLLLVGTFGVTPNLLAEEKPAGESPPPKSILEILKGKAEAAKEADAKREAERKAAETAAQAARDKEGEAKKGEADQEPPAAAEQKGGEGQAEGSEKAKPEGGAAETKESAPAAVMKVQAVEVGAVQVEGVPGEVKVVVEGEVAPQAQGGQGAGTEAAVSSEPEKKEPQIPLFRLRDGTRISGTPELTEFHVETAYGKLLVPVTEVLRVRFASAKDPELADKIAAEVKNLGSEEFDTREQAEERLRTIGIPALEALKAALSSDDAEVKTRAEKLVGEIEENVDEDEDPELAHLSPIAGEDDEVVTFKFTVLGRIEESDFKVETRYGPLNLNRESIISVVFQEPTRIKRTFTVPGSTFAGANKWLSTDLELTQGTPIRIAASGTITLENFGQTTGPEGTTNVSGNQFQNFPVGCLVARIGEKGQAFRVGSEFDGTANATGKLQFGISFQNGQINGQFQVEVELEVEP